MLYSLLFRALWGYSSAGRALDWQSRGQRFDPAYLHHEKDLKLCVSSLFYFRKITGILLQTSVSSYEWPRGTPSTHSVIDGGTADLRRITQFTDRDMPDILFQP